MKKIKLAILGQGRSGFSIHGRHLLTDTERFKVVAVVDRLPERRRKAAELFGCSVFDDPSALHGMDIDLVVNALPSPFHYPVTIDMLKSGFNVLCEKPATRTVELLDEMVSAARENGKTLAFFQQSRFAPYFTKVKEVIASGKLGRIVQISIAFNGFARRWDWQCIQDNIAGSLYNTGPHPVDQALNLLDGEEIPQILCKMDSANCFGDAEDYVKIIMTLPEKPLIDLEISSCDAYPWGTYKLMGTRGSLVGNMQHLDWQWFTEQEAPQQKLITTPLSTDDGKPAYCSEKLLWHKDSWDAKPDENAFVFAVNAYYTNLYEHLTQGKALEVTAAQVRRQIAVICECHRQNPMPRRFPGYSI